MATKKKTESTKIAELMRKASALAADPTKHDQLKKVMEAISKEVATARADAEKVAEESSAREKLFRAVATRYLNHAYADTKAMSATLIGDHTPKFGEEVMGTLRAGQGGEGNVASYPIAGSFEEYGRGNWRQAEVGATLRASGGCLGGGSETLVKAPERQQESGSLLAFGAGESSERSMVLAFGLLPGLSDVRTMPISDLAALVRKVASVRPRTHKVRRLTDVEAARLQGFPDFWHLVAAPKGGKKGKKGNAGLKDAQVSQRIRMYRELGRDYTAEEIRSFISDGDAYTAYGNSIAVPVLRHLFRKMTAHIIEVMPERVVFGRTLAEVSGFQTAA